jgi:hypothetical protein
VLAAFQDVQDGMSLTQRLAIEVGEHTKRTSTRPRHLQSQHCYIETGSTTISVSQSRKFKRWLPNSWGFSYAFDRFRHRCP